LFFATCLSTTWVYAIQDGLRAGLMYSASLMTILLCHEFGHFLQAVRYGVPASLPFFIPVPLPPLGTMGAVIAMRGNMGNRRSLFDIGISGPLAGLVPALIFSVVGLHWSEIATRVDGSSLRLSPPLIFHWMISWLGIIIPDGKGLELHPV